MKKYFSILVLLLFVNITKFQGQNISITPIVPRELGLTSSMSNILKQKLLQITTVNGFGSSSGEFILTANIIPLEKDVIPTVPSQVKVKLEISIYAVGVTEKIIIDEYSFEVSAMDRNENLATSKALKQINYRKPEIKAFMVSVREKIEQYYIDRTPILITKAQQLAEREEYDKALAVLSTIPESVSEYITVSNMMSSVYLQMIDRYALRAIQEANNNIILKKYPEALECLLYVDPMSTHAKEALSLINKIKQNIEENERQKYNNQIETQVQNIEMIKQSQGNETNLKKMQIEASYDAAKKAQGTDTELVEKKVSDWLFDLLK